MFKLEYFPPLIVAISFLQTALTVIHYHGDIVPMIPQDQSWDAPAAVKKPPFHFSACLIIKDSNIILPEWLAYHYTRLPLRRLIVAVDPLSVTDPSPILDEYARIGLNTTIWQLDPSKGRDLFSEYKQRQKDFYASCLKQLKSEWIQDHSNAKWALFIDVDEYLSFNHYEEGEGKPSHCRGDATCIHDFDEGIKNGTHYRKRFGEFKTAAAYINEPMLDPHFYSNKTKPCIVISRLLFPAKETGLNGLPTLPSGLNASNFHTLRFRHRASVIEPQIGKSMVDLSRMRDYNIPSIHRLNNNCTGNNGWVHNSEMGFRVHHYVGTWESFRRPGFDSRGKRKFDERNRVKALKLDTSIDTTWLTKFVNQVGIHRALTLTQDFRMDAELEMLEKIIMQTNNQNESIIE
mmetsp:Transcript_7544/g.16306  ORF Transcript_7544/g.16306 Transcript_7544/m.16306 type:complete len:404 (-) Transcript_7544:183-1394(-)